MKLKKNSNSKCYQFYKNKNLINKKDKNIYKVKHNNNYNNSKKILEFKEQMHLTE